jgi:hypothetical protein
MRVNPELWRGAVVSPDTSHESLVRFSSNSFDTNHVELIDDGAPALHVRRLVCYKTPSEHELS